MSFMLNEMETNVYMLGSPPYSINTPSNRGVCLVRVRDPVEREKKKGDSKQRLRKDTGR